VVVIEPDGRITADADGFSGDACVRDLERLLDEAAPGRASLSRKQDRPEHRSSLVRAQRAERKP
jgi:hypothetical protein